MSARVAGVSVWGPGLPGWAASRPILAGEAPYRPAETLAPPPVLLSAGERRRAGTMVRLALLVAHQAVEMSGMAASEVRVIFGSACSDGAIIGSILDTLAGDDHQLSPTLFHNSVHNAPAGYWTIATRSRQPVTSLGADAATFPAALLAGMSQVADGEGPVLVCVYDVPLPAPLLATRPSAAMFGFALVLVPPPAGQGALLSVRYVGEPAVGPCEPRAEGLRALSRDNPATVGLRLLEALACEETVRVDVPYLAGRLAVAVSPSGR